MRRKLAMADQALLAAAFSGITFGGGVLQGNETHCREVDPVDSLARSLFGVHASKRNGSSSSLHKIITPNWGVYS